MKKDYKLIAFDLDGTLTQHRTKLGPENKAVLDKLAKNHKLIMIGAGACQRIFGQMNEYPIDIIGNYGMEVAKYNPETKQLDIVDKAYVAPDRERTEKVCQQFREKYGFTEYAGDAVEFHASGMITFPLIGTKAKIEDKLSFDPDRSRRKVFYDEVKAAFPDYTVFIGGSSSLTLLPILTTSCTRWIATARRTASPMLTFSSAATTTALAATTSRSTAPTLILSR